MSTINVGLDRENRVNGKVSSLLQPPGGEDHLSTREEDGSDENCNNLNALGKIQHRITQPPGGKSSDIFGLQLDNQNGNLNQNGDRPYKMASSFALGDDQPDSVYMRAGETLPKGEGTFQTLFGPPSPELSKVEKARLRNREPSDYQLKPSRKPLPVSPLTGDILGLPGAKTPEPSRRKSALSVNLLTGQVLGDPAQVVPDPPVRQYNPESVPPGGRSTPIW